MIGLVSDFIFIVAVTITATLASVTAGYIFKKSKRSDEIAGIVFLVTGFGLIIYNYGVDIVEVKDKTYTIYSTSSSSSMTTHGSFVLGTGTIYSKEMYLANIKVGNNKFERLYIPVDETIRIIDSNLSDKAIYHKLFCKVNHPFTKGEFQHCYDYNGTKDLLYIPEKSIIKILNFQ